MRQKSEAKINILVVEDDVNLGYLLQENLRDKGFETTIATNGKSAMNEINQSQFDLCILDIMLPGEDGFAVAAYLRRTYPELPFIFLTARALEKDKLQAFESGAEDYMTKPFSFKELVFRIKVILRRQNKALDVAEKSTTFSLGNTMLNPMERTLTIGGKIQKISNRECELLTLLLQNESNYLSRSEILKKVWGRDDYFTARSMDVFVTRLRKLLKNDEQLEIENLYGTGYRIRTKI